MGYHRYSRYTSTTAGQQGTKQCLQSPKAYKTSIMHVRVLLKDAEHA